MSSNPKSTANAPQEAVAEARTLQGDEELVAIIGLGCVMPDAPDVPTFWQNIKSGRNSIGEVPPDRWDTSVYYDPDSTRNEGSYTKIGAFIRDFKFNPLDYRIPPKVGASLDGVQQMGIAATAQALKDAGYDKKPFDRTRVAVILGQAMGGEVQRATTGRVLVPSFAKNLKDSKAFMALPTEQQVALLAEFEEEARKHFPEITEDTMPGELANIVAGRIANVFNLSGANFTTDAACASSLAAIDMAVKSLVNREFEMVLTGGADRSMDIATYVKFCRIGALSAKGSFPFDARADGFVMGEGTGIMLLKRLSDALRDGDKIYAVIRGVGSSSDGKGKGITAPNIEGQLKCVKRALEHAGISPDTVGLIECHGTSTAVGDVVEVQALQQIWEGAKTKPKSIAIGSVKSQVGHLKSAAGAAGLIKAIMALSTKTLPPSINFETPNPKINWANSPFYVNTKTQPWPDPSYGGPRRASVSSFGFGGTNFNVIIEEYVPGVTQPKTSSSKPATPVTDVLLKRTAKPAAQSLAYEPLPQAASTEVILLAADTHEGALKLLENTRRDIAEGQVPADAFATWAHRVSTKNLGKNVRVAIVAEGPQDLDAKLAAAPDAVKDPKKRLFFTNKGIYVGEGKMAGKVAFLFPGQGSQYVDMLRDLATRYERVRQTLIEADDVMVPFIGKPITKFIFMDESAGIDRNAAEEALKKTEICQPAVLAADLALYRLLGDYGITPHMVAGHSLGEYGATVAAGVMTLKDSLVAVSARGREMAKVHVEDLGKMASVSADPEIVAEHLKGIDGYVIPANKNCKVQTVIAGASPSVDKAVEMFNSKGIQAQHINVSAAFHSSIVAPAQGPFKKTLAAMDIRAPKIPILSNVHADFYPTGPDAPKQIVDLLTQQIASPVEWQKQIDRMYAEGVRIFIEVGPKKTLTSFVANILEGKPFFAVATNHPKKGGFWHLNETVAVMAAAGAPVRFLDPSDPNVSTPTFRERLATSAPATAPTTNTPATNGTQSLDADRVKALGLNLDRILITGVSAGTPGKGKHVFASDNFDRIFRGDNHIDRVDSRVERAVLAKNITRLVKSSTGNARFETIHDLNEVIHLMGRRGAFDLKEDYGIDQDLVDALDITSSLAIAAGLEALRDSGIPLVQSMVKTTTGKFLPGGWVLPLPLQAETGVIFASAFPGYNRLIETISRHSAKAMSGSSLDQLADIYADLIKRVRDPEVRRELTTWYTNNVQGVSETKPENLEEFNRRFLFHVLSMGHSQLAQLIKAKGPNTQVNSACASTTIALGIAEDWIRTGRCKRVLVVASDDITSDVAAEWFGAGFLAAGAATTKDKVEDAALPFDRRRHGMIVGMGAVGLVVEAEEEVKARGQDGIVEVVATLMANSAYHGSRLDTEHVATTMDQLMATVERRLGITRHAMAADTMFMSHETYTPARGGSAAAEILALRHAFGASANKVVVANTKGFTGHPQGASIEDAIAIRALQMGRVPPIANLKEPDPELGDLNLSQGGSYDVKYALRLAAGFGSQIGLSVYKLRSKDIKRIVDPAKYNGWLAAMSGNRNPELEIVNRSLRVKSSMTTAMKVETASPAQPAAPSIPAPAAKPPMAPKPVISPPVAAVSKDEIRARLMSIFAEKTGYPQDMLEPDLDLEADLGIDTVKQAEIFGILRDSYGLEQDPNVQLKDYPTINAIADYMAARAAAKTPTAAAPSAKVVTPPPMAAPKAAPAPTPTKSQSSGTAITREAVAERLIDLFAQKTGYPKEMLEPDLDLEADLGIDTVKQAEIFGVLRESYGLEQDPNLLLKDYPTLNHIIDYMHKGAQARTGAPASPTPSAPTPAPVAATPAPAAAAKPATGAVGREQVLARLLDLFADKTGYPKEMLEPDLDLEADLGIDTVKQAEIFGMLRDSYGLQQDPNLQLKDYPTLNHIADYIHGRMGTSAPATPAPAAQVSTPAPPAKIPAPTPPAPEPAKTQGAPKDKAAVVARIRTLVAQKTGYPENLLEEDLDLEADLGIDTVKQAEVFGDVRELYSIPPIEGLQLSSYPTLGRVADFVLEHAGQTTTTPPTAAPEAPQPVAKAPPAATPVGDKSLTKRFSVHYVARPGAPIAADKATLKDQVLLGFVEDGADAWTTAVKARGGRLVRIHALPTTPADAKNAVAALRKEHPKIDGLIIVTPTTGLTNAKIPEGAEGAVKGIFHLLKELMTTGKSGELATFGVVTHLGGDFGTGLHQPIDVLDGAAAGLAKAVARELTHCRVKVLDVPAKMDPKTQAATLVEELGRDDGVVEIGTLEGRGTLMLLEDETVEENPGVELGADDVLLVPGGAQGITSEIAKAMAQQWKTKFVFLGRTKLVDGVERLAALDEAGLAAKKNQIMEALKAKGERVTPMMVEREFSKITKSIEIHNTVQAIQAAGGDALYEAADVTDPKAVAAVAELGRKLFGPITGVIHAAGVEESKLIVDKTAESFDRVFDVKVLGATALYEATREDTLKLWINFASVAGRFGNAGQADYSAANDALGKFSLALRLDHGGSFPALTIDWSAWDEKGMATRGSIMKVLKAIGVEPIPLAAGVARCLDELAHGMQDAELVIAAELGQLAAHDVFTTREAASRLSKGADAPKEGGKGQQVLIVQDGKGAVTQGRLVTRIDTKDAQRITATLSLDADVDPYLDDHSIDGHPVFPGVFGVESFAETAQALAPGLRFIGVRDMDFRLPLKLLRRKATEANLVAVVAQREDDHVEVGCRLESVFVNPKGQRMGAPRIHFTGTLLFGSKDPTPAKPVNVPEVAQPLDQTAIYKKFFHGPSFRVLKSLGTPKGDAKTAVGVYCWPQKGTLSGRDDHFLTAPLVRELAFQTAGGHELFAHDELALPRRIAKSRFYASPKPGQTVIAVATYKSTKDAVSTYDVTVQTSEGKVLEVLEGFELIRVNQAVQVAAEAGSLSQNYRSRWGHDLPVPMPGARAVIVNDHEIRESGLDPKECLTEGERSDQERYRNDKRAREFFLGRLAAKEAVALLLERPVKEARGVDVRRLDSGQPEVRSAQGQDVFVSISHHGPYAIAIAARKGKGVKAVGVDLDVIEPKSEGFESESFTTGERKLIDTLARAGRNRAELQLALWTVKEAVLKALGQGFALALHDVRITKLNEDGAEVELGEKAQACLHEIGGSTITVQTWTRDNYAYALAWLT